MKSCLIGEKLKYSYSQEIHKFFGVDYSLVEIEHKDLENFVKNSDYDYYNVTIPYKTEIIPFLDEISEEAKAIGAVNTVKKCNGKTYGYNTDIEGIRYVFRHNKIDLKGKNVLIAGSGGASKTVAYFCKKEGANVNVVSRTGEINYVNCYKKCENTNIFVNATPVGTSPNLEEKIVDLSGFPDLEFVFDLVYNPIMTALLMQAKEMNIKYDNGLAMLVKQAVEAERIWGNETKLSFEHIYNYLLKEKTNIVLIGMPSCGKTTIGEMVAKELKRKFFDSDRVLEENFGKIPCMITKKGEEFFRNKEEEIIRLLSKNTGVVISVGGGAILRQKNIDLLRQNGLFFYINRKLELLSAENRPLSQGVGVQTLFEQRKEIYEKTQNFTIFNNSDNPEIPTEEIIDKFNNYFK